MRGATLDASALIALDRGTRNAMVLFDTAFERGDQLAIPAGALAQAWRGGSRQARLARLLSSSTVEVVPLDARSARVIGGICRSTGAADVIDVSVALCARTRRHQVITSDPDDIRRIDPTLEIIAI